ncbi:MAG: helix-turn-helix domain-containing protein [Gemmatimonadetes bacterium]|nr:helix-turn-helix domain-containing protein [Gemmatimonadota bacterium]
MSGAARAELYDYGMWPVLCDSEKRPLFPNWQRFRPTFEEMELHRADGGLVGHVPYHLELAGVDIDEGPAEALTADYPAAAVLPSRRPGGKHVYYRESRPLGNKKIFLVQYGIRGDLRSAKGYLIVWHDSSWGELAKAAAADPNKYPMPDSLFEAAGVPAPRAIASPPLTIAAARAGLEPLESVNEGARNDSLFDHVRLWAYAEPRGTSKADWRAHVRNHAATQNLRFAKPLPGPEVAVLARSIADWTWDRPDWGNREAQARRGRKSGKVRQAMTADLRREAHRLRDKGLTVRAIAEELGRPRSTVSDWLKQPVPPPGLPGLSGEPSGGKGTEMEKRP